MKILPLLALFAQILFGEAYDLSPKKVSEGVYCFFGERSSPNAKNKGNMVNSCFIDAGKYAVVVDTGPSYNYAAEVHKQIKKTLHKPVKYVVNTHFHDDHLSGNLYWHDANVTIIGHKNIKKAYETIPDRFTRMQTMFDESIFGKKGIYLPDVLLDGGYEIDKNIEIIKLVDKSHTDSDLIVMHKPSKTLIVADLVFVDMISPLRDADIDGWLVAIGKLKKMGAKHIVGGHGDNTSATSYEFIERYLTTLRTKVKKAMDGGADMVEITTKVDMSEFKNAALFDEVNGKNILRAYELYEAEQK
jgi:cyclase